MVNAFSGSAAAFAHWGFDVAESVEILIQRAMTSPKSRELSGLTTCQCDRLIEFGALQCIRFPDDLVEFFGISVSIAVYMGLKFQFLWLTIVGNVVFDPDATNPFPIPTFQFSEGGVDWG
jgi:hypothetical protein